MHGNSYRTGVILFSALLMGGVFLVDLGTPTGIIVWLFSLVPLMLADSVHQVRNACCGPHSSRYPIIRKGRPHNARRILAGMDDVSLNRTRWPLPSV